MPFYRPLRDLDEPQRIRVAHGLRRLRKQFAAELPPRDLADSLLLATWNLREFGGTKYGGRQFEDPIYYVAEIISRFDLVALQEIRDLGDLNRVMRVLGSWWDVLYTDVTAGRAGNEERTAIVFDTRKVRPTGLAGEIVLPDETVKSKTKGAKPRSRPVTQFARTPFICGFQAGWSKFNLCTVHIYYGESKPLDKRRVKEIESLASFLNLRAQGGLQAREKNADPEQTRPRRTTSDVENFVLLGDFNIFKREDATFKALTDNNFILPKAMMKADKPIPGSNAKKDKFYDQIVYYKKRYWLEGTDNAGVFDFYQSVFRDDEADLKLYQPLSEHITRAKDPFATYRQWRTFQMSDHLPLWLQLKINFTDSYLGWLTRPAARPATAPPPATPSGEAVQHRIASKAEPRKRVATKVAAKKKAA